MREPPPWGGGGRGTHGGAGAPQGAARGLLTYMPKPGCGQTKTVTLIPGGGIGLEVSYTDSVVQIVDTLEAPIMWERRGARARRAARAARRRGSSRRARARRAPGAVAPRRPGTTRCGRPARSGRGRAPVAAPRRSAGRG
jgi:hypothetical protein